MEILFTITATAKFTAALTKVHPLAFSIVNSSIPNIKSDYYSYALKTVPDAKNEVWLSLD
ncbi:hypothetical protein NDI49_14835 [Trichocoleus sp. ST-U3]